MLTKKLSAIASIFALVAVGCNDKDPMSSQNESRAPSSKLVISKNKAGGDYNRPPLQDTLVGRTNPRGLVVTTSPATGASELVPVKIPTGTKLPLINSSANDNERGWTFFGETGVTTIDNNKVFYIAQKETPSSYISQDVKLPSQSGNKYLLLIGYSWVEKAVQSSITRHPSLYAYEEDESGRILNYLQGQKMLHTASSRTWQTISGIFQLQSNASIIRFFLQQAEMGGDPSDGTQAVFDDLELRLFDTMQEAEIYKSMYEKNHPELNTSLVPLIGIYGTATDSRGNGIAKATITFPLPTDFGRPDPFSGYLDLEDPETQEGYRRGLLRVAQISQPRNTKGITLNQTVTSPNGDGINDRFVLESTSQAIRSAVVYNDRRQQIQGIPGSKTFGLSVESNRIQLLFAYQPTSELPEPLDEGKYTLEIVLSNGETLQYRIAYINPVIADVNGKYILEILPPGAWTIAVFQAGEELGVTREVTVPETGSLEVNFTF